MMENPSRRRRSGERGADNKLADANPGLNNGNGR